MKTRHIAQRSQSPAKWPFPPAPQPRKKSGGSWASQRGSSQKGLTRGAMLRDICLVAMWGATIPGLMWLGAAGGF